MSRQDNSNSDNSSSKSQIDLYEKAKGQWTQEIQGLLDNMIDGVKDISDWLLTAKEIDHLAKQVTDKKRQHKIFVRLPVKKKLKRFQKYAQNALPQGYGPGMAGYR